MSDKQIENTSSESNEGEEQKQAEQPKLVTAKVTHPFFALALLVIDGCMKLCPSGDFHHFSTRKYSLKTPTQSFV